MPGSANIPPESEDSGGFCARCIQRIVRRLPVRNGGIRCAPTIFPSLTTITHSFMKKKKIDTDNYITVSPGKNTGLTGVVVSFRCRSI